MRDGNKVYAFRCPPALQDEIKEAGVRYLVGDLKQSDVVRLLVEYGYKSLVERFNALELAKEPATPATKNKRPKTKAAPSKNGKRQARKARVKAEGGGE
jgi:hypothetical protein